MKKIFFCQDNDFKTKSVYKRLKDLDLDIKIKRKDCIGECKTCKHSPFSIIDGKVIKSDTAEELFKKIYKKVN